MLLDNETSYALSMCLEDYIKFPDEYYIPQKIIFSSETDDNIYKGFSTDNATELLNNISDKQFNIDDKNLDYILRIVYTFKDSINDFLNMNVDDTSAIEQAKNDRKSVNALIRLIKSYGIEHGISFDCLQDNQ